MRSWNRSRESSGQGEAGSDVLIRVESEQEREVRGGRWHAEGGVVEHDGYV